MGQSPLQAQAGHRDPHMQALSSCMKSRGFPRPRTGLRRDGVGPRVLGTRIACPQDLPREQQPSRPGVLNTQEKGAQQQ